MADKYEKVVKLGEGSFGVVWKVKHRQTGQHFAVKKIRMQSRDHGVSLAAIDEINALQVCSWCSVFVPPDPSSCDACACLLSPRVLASRYCARHLSVHARRLPPRNLQQRLRAHTCVVKTQLVAYAKSVCRVCLCLCACACICVTHPVLRIRRSCPSIRTSTW